MLNMSYVTVGVLRATVLYTCSHRWERNVGLVQPVSLCTCVNVLPVRAGFIFRREVEKL